MYYVISFRMRGSTLILNSVFWDNSKENIGSDYNNDFMINYKWDIWYMNTFLDPISIEFISWQMYDSQTRVVYLCIHLRWFHGNIISHYFFDQYCNAIHSANCTSMEIKKKITPDLIFDIDSNQNKRYENVE